MLFEVCVADDLLQTVAVDIPCSKWSVLLLSIVMQVAMSEVLKVYPQLDDKKEFVCGRENERVAQAVPKVVSKLKSVMR